jgi:translation initiation factor IF-1
VAGVHIFVPVLAQKVAAEADGTFQATLKAGHYQVLISAKKYLTQKKEIRIRNGDVVIMNIDLRPKKKHGG